MSEVTKPIALDESFNTTGQTPKNIADVIKNGLQEVAQAIDSHQGGGGHVILDQNGNALDQEPNMQFVDAHLTDDSTNEKTVIENIKSVTEAQFESATEDGLYDVDVEGAEIGEISEDYVQVTADGVKTYATLLNELYALVDFNKVSKNAILTLNGLIYNPIIVQNDGYYFSRSGVENNLPAIFEIGVRESNSYYNYYQNNQYTNRTNDTVPVGTKLTLYYGNDKAVVDLQTTANRCLMSNGESVEQRLNKTSCVLNTISSSVLTIADAIANIYNQLKLLGISDLLPINYSVFWTGHDRYYGEAILYSNSAHLTLIGYNNMYVCDVDNGTVTYKTVSLT